MTLTLLYPENNAVLPRLTELHKDFFKNGGNKDSTLGTFDYMSLFRQGIDNSFGEPVTLKLDYDKEVSVLISTSCNFTESKEYRGKNSIDIYNLLLGTKYYWKVCADDGTISEIRCFTTESQPPRWIKTSSSDKKSDGGVTNIRDLGGWTAENGKKVKQGLIFRGSEMNDHCILTEEGKDIFLNDLKLKTILDLRKVEFDCPLGDKVNYIRIPMLGAYERISEFKEDYRKMLDIFMHSENYPIYVHCWGGADRTGTLIFLLGALLNISAEDLFLEYELTSFSVWGPRSSDSELFTGFKETLKEYGENEDILTQCKNFVLSTGITENDIERFKQILLV